MTKDTIGDVYRRYSHNDSDSDAKQAEFKFLRHSLGYWEFPKKQDIKIVEARFVFHGPCTLSEISKRGYKFKEDIDALQRYKIIKSRK